ncbi:NAD(P)/FAD-dependent oxidoreductase [Mycobacterium marinum]|uniref:NAD(P)/FAD-dependent oxidoreductase n=1 Tax=Mycobacterium marinum TaxID=1781 RepID=UPI000B973448|nr:FAD-dependent oxidoreductase [Mycobacterium marinum]MDC8993949.1 FAD-dependent oxidoreductase [Mycobacterium marinum]MDC9018633.1 FAD-dependent oxidoreductase [Mycobacterium marinum]WDZ15430.1 FAD-dependent oxidoreductase [Mycobacterium marinum]
MTAKQHVCVVGAGIFGVSTALSLARDGWRVDLVERSSDILTGASGCNIFRLHRGYHYPRSLATAVESRDSERSFRAEYNQAIIDGTHHMYAVAAEGSLVTGAEFMAHCAAANLPVEPTSHPAVKQSAVQLLVSAKESRIDPNRLALTARSKLLSAGVNVRTHTPADPKIQDRYDFVVLAANHGNNSLLAEFGIPVQRRQFEVCEVAVLEGVESGDIDIVVIDGPFVSLSPYGRNTGQFLLYDVEHSVRHRTVATVFEPPSDTSAPLATGAPVPMPDSAVTAMLDSASRFVRGLRHARHVGSLLSVRTVLPDVDGTDERPTLIKWHTDTTLSIFSGKIVTAVAAGQAVAESLRSRNKPGLLKGTRRIHSETGLNP